MAAKKQPKQTEIAPEVPEVRVDNSTRRSDDDALEGHFVDVIAGDHAGLRGAYVQNLSSDPETGYPDQILVRNRDHTGSVDLVAVAYADVRPADPYKGGR